MPSERKSQTDFNGMISVLIGGRYISISIILVGHR